MKTTAKSYIMGPTSLSVVAVPTIIKRLKAKGYKLVTVSQLLDNQALPGLRYFGAHDYRTAGK
ncbi:hypothetical protein [Levilactobacillus suantsaiihabitans]|uniref:hypothetical protein n=1 Tax=Levilactobacillus suantsaiihabitans TaxID=2487722 RepID=UPI001CDC30DE|nr:hypothetical protein [Levilactobacillus suantsaiihabitans]